MGKKIRVLIVDDSALVRSILKTQLAKDREIEVIGAVGNVYSARDRIVLDQPDVITLDIEMPSMDGVEFLRRLMPQYPVPVVVVSALASSEAPLTLRALEYGAVDFVLKPSIRVGTGVEAMVKELVGKIKVASHVDVERFRRIGWSNGKVQPRSIGAIGRTTDKVLAIGASTGGTVALRQLISQFPADMPGTVVVQHMPPVFTQRFAEGLNETTTVEVKEAESGDQIIVGRVLIAPGDRHMEVVRSGARYLVRCRDGETVNGHRPSVDVLFHSVSRQAAANAVALLLTGMGADGADGMVALRAAGARTFAQDEATSVVFGMPKEAYRRGGAERLVSLDDMPALLARTFGEMQ